MVKSETQKLQDFLNREMKNGLMSVHFTPSGHSDTVESFAREVNEMLAARTVEDLGLF